jgi:RNA polymerase sigma-70 factor, ECF subfamily
MDDASLFERLLQECGDKAYNFAYRLCGNAAEADDLVQEAFMRALKNLHRFDPNRPFQAWLYQILRNIFLDSVKRADHQRTVPLERTASEEHRPWEDVIAAPDATALDRLMRQEDERIVQEALLSLPLNFRTAVALCDIEGLSYEEIAGVMNCPVGTIRSRIFQGRALMRQAYDRLAAKGGMRRERPLPS